MITIEQEHANKRADLVKFRLALRECRDNAVVARAGIVQLSSKLAPYFSGADQELSLILRHVESILDTIDLASS